jgi:hypothetical protein
MKRTPRTRRSILGEEVAPITRRLCTYDLNQLIGMPLKTRFYPCYVEPMTTHFVTHNIVTNEMNVYDGITKEFFIKCLLNPDIVVLATNEE